MSTVTLQMRGRDGAVHFKDADREVEFYVEISGVPQYDLLVWLKRPASWQRPAGMPISDSEWLHIQSSVKAWFTAQGHRCQFS